MNKITQFDIGMFEDGLRHGDTIQAYQNIATKSAIYPGQGTPLGLVYVALKINGEAGELAEHVGKAMRDDCLISMGYRDEATHDACFVYDELTPERRALIIKEAGDILWYLSAICNELGITLSEVAVENLNKLADRTRRNVLSGSGDER